MENDQSLSGKIILLVDDDELFREVMVETLQDLGLTVLTAANGVEGFEVFKKTPDLNFILSDLRLPRMDGLQLLNQVRKTSSVPFILQTGFSGILKTMDTSDLRVSAFLTKPCTTVDLKKQLLAVLSPRQ